MRRYFDISRARSDLNYSPVVQFEEGWQQTIEWFKLHWLPEFNKKK